MKQWVKPSVSRTPKPIDFGMTNLPLEDDVDPRRGSSASKSQFAIDQPFERLTTLSNLPSNSQVRYRSSTPPRRALSVLKFKVTAFEGVIRSSRSQLQ
jgi:hypothetical protein